MFGEEESERDDELAQRILEIHKGNTKPRKRMWFVV